MLPTPSTSHLTFTHIYEPAEDSYLLLDTLSSPSESAFLHAHFPKTSPSPLIVEVGSGSGIVLAFLTANAKAIFGRSDVYTLTTDVSKYACAATAQTVLLESGKSQDRTAGIFLGAVNADMYSPLCAGRVDVLVFNPPYVPTPDVPRVDDLGALQGFEEESRYLELTYAGGPTGMVITDRFLEGLGRVLSERGVLYLLLCAQNKPEEVAQGLRGGRYGGVRWKVEKVGSSGKRGGWEVLSIWRVSRD